MNEKPFALVSNGKMRRPKIIFILSLQRSGSTLLDMLLGQSGYCCSLGEIKLFWERGLLKNELCGCGNTFNDCPFWTEVRNGIDISEVQFMTECVSSNLSLAKTFGGVSTVFLPRSVVRRCQFDLNSLYREISRTIGESKYIVDSSKDLIYALFLLTLPLELHVVHLTRR